MTRKLTIFPDGVSGKKPWIPRKWLDFPSAEDTPNSGCQWNIHLVNTLSDYQPRFWNKNNLSINLSGIFIYLCTWLVGDLNTLNVTQWNITSVEWKPSLWQEGTSRPLQSSAKWYTRTTCTCRCINYTKYAKLMQTYHWLTWLFTKWACKQNFAKSEEYLLVTSHTNWSLTSQWIGWWPEPNWHPLVV